jgi:hypothetical protein
VSQPRIDQETARRAVVIFMDKDAAWNDPKRSLENTHITIEKQMMDVGAIEQSPDRRHQNHVVRSQQFAQGPSSYFCGIKASANIAIVMPDALAARRGTFYCQLKSSLETRRGSYCSL